MKRKPNPIKGTVARFLSQGTQQWMREQKKLENGRLSAPTRSKRPPESNFVRFFKSLENRGRESVRTGTIYDLWTKRIRSEMEKAGTWPTGMQEYSAEVIIEYISRLQRIFWTSLPGYDSHLNHDFYDLLWCCRIRKGQIGKVYCDVFDEIYTKIRRKGIRSKLFVLSFPDEYEFRRQKSCGLYPYVPQSHWELYYGNTSYISCRKIISCTKWLLDMTKRNKRKFNKLIERRKQK